MVGGPVMHGSAGTPLKNARIVVKAEVFGGATIIQPVTTDANGEFGLGLQPGWYTLTARFNYPLLPARQVVHLKSDQAVRVRFVEAIK